MMSKRNRIQSGHSASFGAHYESEGSGSSGRIDSAEDSSVPMRKWVDLNSASKDGFAVPLQIITLSKLSSSERKTLVLRLTSELDQIRFLQNKVESHKKRFVNAVTVSSSSDILSCNYTKQKGQQVGNAKKSSGFCSGSGNKLRGWNRGTTGRFESGNQDAGLLKQCEGLLKKLMSHQYAWVFNSPVDVVKLNIPTYFDVIKHPMDLGTIKGKLSSGKYSSPLDFLADVRLTFTNAKTFNPRGTDVHIMADAMSQFFELRWKAIEKKLSVTSQSLPEKSRVHEETEIAKPMGPSKKRKLGPIEQEVIQNPPRQMMTDEEKHKLSCELEDMLGDLPDSIIEFLKSQSTNGGDGGEDEIEIDIDVLSDATLLTLRKLLDDHSKVKEKNLTKSEACEIELPNVSGFSNSSLQVDKGNGPIDEDVDIGGNEAPVTSKLPVELDKGVGGRAEECAEAASISGLDHLEQGSQPKQYSSDSDDHHDGESAQAESQVSPDKQYRAAILKNRYLDTILKAREKTLSQDEKGDPEKLRREREKLEKHKKKEKARLQAEAKAAEDARRKVEAEAAAEAKKRRELEREAAREALLKMEKTVEINENSRFLEDLEMLRAAPPEQLLISSVNDMSPDQSQDGFGDFSFGGSNPLEKLGLFMKVDEEEEEGEPPSVAHVVDDAEEGEIE